MSVKIEYSIPASKTPLALHRPNFLRAPSFILFSSWILCPCVSISFYSLIDLPVLQNSRPRCRLHVDLWTSAALIVHPILLAKSTICWLIRSSHSLNRSFDGLYELQSKSFRRQAMFLLEIAYKMTHILCPT